MSPSWICSKTPNVYSVYFHRPSENNATRIMASPPKVLISFAQNSIISVNFYFSQTNPTAVRISLIQMIFGNDKDANLDHAEELILRTAANDEPRVVALPECFNSPYSTKDFHKYAETIPDGPTSQRLSAIAKKAKVYLIGGSIPERDAVTDNLYNTCPIFSPTGDYLGKYRKVNLTKMKILRIIDELNVRCCSTR